MSNPISQDSILKTLYDLSCQYPSSYFEDALIGFKTSNELMMQHIPFYITPHLEALVANAFLLESATIVNHVNSETKGYRIIPARLDEVRKMLSSRQITVEDNTPIGDDPNKKRLPFPASPYRR